VQAARASAIAAATLHRMEQEHAQRCWSLVAERG
jgi:hypothetical protein